MKQHSFILIALLAFAMVIAQSVVATPEPSHSLTGKKLLRSYDETAFPGKGSRSDWLIAGAEETTRFQGKEVFDRIVVKATDLHWNTLPIGELMGRIAEELQGTGYKSCTLELSPDREICSVNLNALDCVTFFETTLGFSRVLKTGPATPANLLRQICLTRYRDGTADGYTSRLHYMSDWLIDNQSKHVIKILSELPGAQVFNPKINYMTSHPQSSIQLKSHPELIAAMRRYEQAISHRPLIFIPNKNLPQVEGLLKTGDIVAVCTDIPGLDVSHTGLVFKTKDGVAHFMDASSRKGVMKVVLEKERLSQTLAQIKHSTGAMFARPLEP